MTKVRDRICGLASSGATCRRALTTCLEIDELAKEELDLSSRPKIDLTAQCCRHLMKKQFHLASFADSGRISSAPNNDANSSSSAARQRSQLLKLSPMQW